ncbi:hypothetical protein D3C80_1731330 [compost metagenome]
MKQYPEAAIFVAEQSELIVHALTLSKWKPSKLPCSNILYQRRPTNFLQERHCLFIFILEFLVSAFPKRFTLAAVVELLLILCKEDS